MYEGPDLAERGVRQEVLICMHIGRGSVRGIRFGFLVAKEAVCERPWRRGTRECVEMCFKGGY